MIGRNNERARGRDVFKASDFYIRDQIDKSAQDPTEKV